jgi:PTH1 family peptidyl-tRNA hydrolase
LLAVVGLGNPGGEYEESRHNVGFRVVDALAGGKGPFESKERFLFLGSRIAGRKALLVKPVTFMNRSGSAVALLLEEWKIPFSGLLVVSDDASLPLGRIRIRAEGGAGGQKGLESIIDRIGTDAFPRLRLGIGSPEEDEDLADYVLRPFEEEERAEVEQMTRRAVSCVREWAKEGIGRAMERYNRKESPEGGAQGDEASES